MKRRLDLGKVTKAVQENREEAIVLILMILCFIIMFWMDVFDPSFSGASLWGFTRGTE